MPWSRRLRQGYPSGAENEKWKRDSSLSRAQIKTAPRFQTRISRECQAGHPCVKALGATGILPVLLPGAAGWGSPGKGGRKMLRALDEPGVDPELLSSLRNSRELPHVDRISDAFLGKTQLHFLLNTGDRKIYHPNQNTSGIQRRSSQYLYHDDVHKQGLSWGNWIYGHCALGRVKYLYQWPSVT